MTEKKDTSKALTERRRFTIEQEDGSKKEYFLGTPTADDIRGADWEHAKMYNKALKEGVFTTGEMMSILESRNIAGPDYDKTAEDLSNKLADKIVEMEKETDPDTRVKLALEAQRARNEVFQWSNRINTPLSATCESIASEARVEYLTSAIIQDAQGERIWEDFEQYKAEADIIVQAKAKFEVMMWMEGLEPNIMENTPEALVLKEDLYKELEEKEEVEEEPKKTAPKKTTPKKTRRKKASKKKLD